MRKVPLRRCVVCRRSFEKSKLLRMVLENGFLLWDKQAKAPGRGAYLCDRYECLSRMADSNVWARSFGVKPAQVEAQGLSRVFDEISKELIKLDKDHGPEKKLRL